MKGMLEVVKPPKLANSEAAQKIIKDLEMERYADKILELDQAAPHHGRD